MKIDVKRFEYGQSYTISKLFVDGKFVCLVLEDGAREVQGIPVNQWKVDGETAIPKGTYKVVMDFSQRFQKITPHILDVPGFEGIRIHCGNTSHDTKGCLLLGTSWSGGDFVGQSQAAMASFLQAISGHEEDLVLQIGDSVQDFS